jgi:hypothetical protein
VLSDWIATPPLGARAAADVPRVLSYRARQRALDTLGLHHSPRPQAGAARGVIRHHIQGENSANDSGLSVALRELEQQVARLGSKQAAMALLQAQMTPALHHHALGLMATRLFYQLMD